MAVPPHGGKLLPLLAQGEDLKRGLDRARHLPQVKLDSREVSDLIMLGMGAFSPLRGFMTRGDYEGVLRDMRLKDGTFWPVPITLAITKEHADSLREGQEVRIFQGVPPGENIRRAGEDVKKGDRVIPKGSVIRAAEVGMLASVSRASVYVHQRPVVTILCTGDELVTSQNSLVANDAFDAAGSTSVSLFESNPTYGHEACAEPSFIFCRGWFDSLKE